MKPDDTLEKLYTAERAKEDDQSVPFAFEKRIMAKLDELESPDPIALWATSLWKACIPCLSAMAIMLVAFPSPPRQDVSSIPAPENQAATEELESLLLAALETDGGEW